MISVKYFIPLAFLLPVIASARLCDNLGGLFAHGDEGRPEACFCSADSEVFKIGCKNANTSQLLDAFARVANLDFEPFQSTEIKLWDTDTNEQFPEGMLKLLKNVKSVEIRACRGNLDLASDVFSGQERSLTTLKVAFCSLNNSGKGLHPAIKHLPFLTALHFDGKGVEMNIGEMKEDMFEGMKLSELSLKYVGLKRLPSVFSSLKPTLKKLDLGDTPVENAMDALKDLRLTYLRICVGPLEPLPNVEGTVEILCEWSHLVNVTFEMLSNLASTKQLAITYAKSIARNALKNMKSLKLLNINSLPRALTRIETGVFENLPQLEVLTIGSANISKLGEPPIFTGLENLKTLSFARSGVQRVEKGAFNGLNNLQLLDLSGNAIKFIEPGLIGSMTKLKKLSMNSNKLLTIEASTLCSSTIEQLELGYNVHIQVTPGTFDGCSNVRTLKLDGLQIQKFPSRVFAPLNSLVDLNICCGQLKELDFDTFANNKDLRKLSLSRNKLESLPEGIFDNNDLSVLSVYGNPWNCTEDLQWLVNYTKTRTDWPGRWKCDGEDGTL